MAAKRVRVNLSIDAKVWRQVLEAQQEHGMVASRVAERAFVHQLQALALLEIGADVRINPSDYRRSV